FLGARSSGLLTRSAGQLFTQGGEPQTTLHQNLRTKTFFFAQNSEQQVFRAHVFYAQAFRFLTSHIQDAFAFRAERNFHGSGDALANSDARFNLFANGLDGSLLPQEAIGQGFILAHQAEQEMLGLDVRTAVLAGLISSKENYATRFFGIAFEHVSSLLPRGSHLQRP